MKVLLLGEKFSVSWCYERAGGGTTTTCYVYNETVGTDYFGYAYCVPPDRFVKETGRKLSLARVLMGMAFSRDERRVFWEAYFHRKEQS